MAYVIQHIVEEKNFKVTPDNLSEYPDYPRKTEDISEEEYKVGCPEWTGTKMAHGKNKHFATNTLSL